MSTFLPRIGELIVELDTECDAIHIAIAPCTAETVLLPGRRIAVTNGIARNITADRQTVAVVDPYLTEPVPAGARFWAFLLPNTVTGLRHNWNHPAFPANGIAESRKWLEHFAESVNMSYENVLDSGETKRFSAHGDEITSVSEERWSQFWTHYAIVKRQPYLDFGYPSTSCSC